MSIVVVERIRNIIIQGSGINGANGVDGTNGTDGSDGQGVPIGGTTGQSLQKIDATDYNTQWADPSGGGDDFITIADIKNEKPRFNNISQSTIWTIQELGAEHKKKINQFKLLASDIV